ncbi:AraC family transcriptional regulator ligand-binding domain-containing protein [Cupriavidus basilensis]
MHTLTRSASLTDYEHVARSVGLDPLRMLRMAKLPDTVLDDPNLMISADSVGWLLEESARLSGQEAFGLLLAETRSSGQSGHAGAGAPGRTNVARSNAILRPLYATAQRRRAIAA